MMREEHQPEWQPEVDVEAQVRRDLKELFEEEDPVLTYTATLACLERGDRVLDLGCGDGALTFYEKLKVGDEGSVAGLDLNSDAIADARDYADYLGLGIEFRVGDIERIPFPEGYFDAVTSHFVLHHLPREIKKRACAEAFRVLKPGGELFIVDYGPGKGIYRWLAPAVVSMLFFVEEMTHVLDNVRRVVPKLIEQAGFENTEIADNLAMRYLTVDFIRAFKPLREREQRAR